MNAVHRLNRDFDIAGRQHVSSRHARKLERNADLNQLFNWQRTYRHQVILIL
jgi:hypothetical protein